MALSTLLSLGAAGILPVAVWGIISVVRKPPEARSRVGLICYTTVLALATVMLCLFALHMTLSAIGVIGVLLGATAQITGSIWKHRKTRTMRN